MKIALDPYMLRGRSMPDMVHTVDWDAFFGTLRELDFDGVATVCVFAWEERAVESSRYMLDRVRKELAT